MRETRTLCIERLGHVVIRATFEAFDDVTWLIAHGNHEDGKFGFDIPCSAAEGDAVRIR